MQSDEALTRAIEAIQLYRAGGPDLDDAALRAVDAVIAATLVHGISHRLIAQKAGCPGLAVIDLMRHGASDDTNLNSRDLAIQGVRAEALRAERHAADRYTAEVMDRIRLEADMRITVRKQPPTTVARDLGVNRASVLSWQSKS